MLALIEDANGDRACSFFMSPNRASNRPGMAVSLSCPTELDLER
jgi:hypothetical protein